MRRKFLFGERMLHGDGAEPFNFVIPVKIKGTIAEEELHDALHRVQQKHPWLNAYVERDKTGYPWYVVRKEKQVNIPVRIANRNTGEDWKAESEKEWERPFQTGTGPLLRLVWLKGADTSEILLVFHHCLCDGVSALNILSEILQILDDPYAEIGVEDPIMGIQDVIPAAILKHPWNRLRARLTGSFITLALKVIPVKKIPADRKKDYFLNWKLSKEETSALMLICKVTGITVNTALCGALLGAFKKVRPQVFNKISCPVDIRRFAPGIKRDQIFAFGLLLVVSAYPRLDFLSNAKAMQLEINRKSAKLNPFRFMMTLESAHASLANFTNLLKYGKSSNDCMFSNLGKIDIPYQYKSLEVETIYSPSVIGPLGNTTTFITSTYRGQLDFSFIASEGFLKQEEAEAIRNAFNQIIKEQLLPQLSSTLTV